MDFKTPTLLDFLLSKTNILLVLCLMVSFSEEKFDQIELEDDRRELIHLVSYGMFKGGSLSISLQARVDMTNVKLESLSEKIGLTIDRTTQSSAQVAQYSETQYMGKALCSLDDEVDSKSIVFRFNLDQQNKSVVVKKGEEMAGLRIEAPLPISTTGMPDTSQKVKQKRGAPELKTDNNPESGSTPTPTTTSSTTTKEAKPVPVSGKVLKDKDNGTAVAINNKGNSTELDSGSSKNLSVSIEKAVIHENATLGRLPLNFTINSTTLSFRVDLTLLVTQQAEQGYFSVYFHNCRRPAVRIKLMDATITGLNTEPLSYLSAGDIPEPYLYFSVAVVYLILTCVWFRVIRTSESGVFKTHYLMLAVCCCKALSALFHGTNFYYIGKQGREETAWAVIYYISYLMKTILLFLTILLVGSGWTFIKHVFSDREKKLFLVALPLQLLVYVAHVIIGETEVAAKTYDTWWTIAIVVDLMCCAAIILPVIWSIKHLQDASQTNGKAALNLQKLKLFKSLYIIIIAYIYITRIVLFVFKMTLPFQLSWLADCVREISDIVLLTTLGYKFRPADDNPYFQIPPDSDDEEEHIEMAITQSGLTTDTKRRIVQVKDESDDEERQKLISSGRNCNESSHEFD